jgi:N-glycosylase/DNA lyase
MHLWRNFTKQWKDKELRGVVWECVRATTPTQFNRIMERVKRLNEKA